jgi:hypothetical protein
VFKWLEVNFPQPEPQQMDDADGDVNDTGLTDEMLAKIHGTNFAVAPDVPASVAAVPTSGNQSAADKIAELKRRASGNGKPDPSGNFVLASGNTVVEREKGVPQTKERVSARDLGDVADLMAGNVSVIKNGAASVQIRDKGRPKHSDVTTSDLLAVTDLMKDR